nr:hypothetical protein [Tanacetum cinerariifolium]
YAAGSESRSPMHNKENYVPWFISSSLIEADDQAIQTILLGIPEDIYATVDSCETAQEIWLRVQQMMNGSDIGIQEKKAKLFNEWESVQGNGNQNQIGNGNLVAARAEGNAARQNGN